MTKCPECGSRTWNLFGYCLECGETVQGFQEYCAQTVDEFPFRPAIAFHTRPLWQSVVVFTAMLAICWFSFGFLWEQVFRGDFRVAGNAARMTRVQAAMVTGFVLAVVAWVATAMGRGGLVLNPLCILFCWFIPYLNAFQKHGTLGHGLFIR